MKNNWKIETHTKDSSIIQTFASIEDTLVELSKILHNEGRYENVTQVKLELDSKNERLEDITVKNLVALNIFDLDGLIDELEKIILCDYELEVGDMDDILEEASNYLVGLITKSQLIDSLTDRVDELSRKKAPLLEKAIETLRFDPLNWPETFPQRNSK